MSHAPLHIGLFDVFGGYNVVYPVTRLVALGSHLLLDALLRRNHALPVPSTHHQVVTDKEEGGTTQFVGPGLGGRGK